MTSARFLIFGAHRETGKPASLVLEASSREEAEAFALQQGVLIQQVQELPSAAARLEAMERAPAPPGLTHAPSPGATGAPSPGAPRALRGPRVVTPGPPESWGDAAASHGPTGHSTREGEGVPTLLLPWPRGFEGLAGERILATYEPRGLELGLLGVMLGRRAKVVLTTHRFIVSQRRLLGGSISTARLDALSGVSLGSRVSTWLMALGLAGLLLTVMGAAQLASASSSTNGMVRNMASDLGGSEGLLGPLQGMLSGAKQGIWAIFVLNGVASIAMMFFAWSKELAACGTGAPVSLRGRTINSARASTLLLATEQAIHTLAQTREARP